LCFGVRGRPFFGLAFGVLAAGEAHFRLDFELIFFLVEAVGWSAVGTYVCEVNKKVNKKCKLQNNMGRSNTNAQQKDRRHLPNH
jgi:hypothetical protein